MAFVKMRNLLGKTIEVPSGAVKAYEGFGFVTETVTPETKKTRKENKSKESEEGSVLNEDEQFVQELEKKPLSQWSKEEVKRYATICDVDISGTKNAQEAKERIKAYIDEKV